MTEPARIQPAPTPGRLGQQTAVEQSRAVEEVRAAIIVAQQCPRDTQTALAQMRESCQMRRLADRAFYRFPRGGQTITGPSVYLARELARCWGNVQYGVAELTRDDDHGQSEMQAWAWDVQTNTRASAVFIVPHKRDKKGGPERLVDMRDIYENNANNGARRLREAIFSILPPYLVEEAKDLCMATVEKVDSEKPLPVRIADMIALFAARVNVTEEQLVVKVGRPSAKWTEPDLAQLRVVAASLARGEVQRDEEFPPLASVTVAEITGQPEPARPEPVVAPLGERVAKLVGWYAEKRGVPVEALAVRVGRPVAEWTEADVAVLRNIGADLSRGQISVSDEFELPDAAGPVAEPPPDKPVDAELVDEPPPAKAGGITATQQKRLFAMLKDLAVTDRAARLRMAGRLLSLPGPLGSFNDLTTTQADDVAVELAQLVGLPEAEGRAQAAIIAAPDEETGQ